MCIASQSATFDDCQTRKGDVRRHGIPRDSTPFGRQLDQLGLVAAQIVHYFHAAVSLRGPDRSFPLLRCPPEILAIFAAYAAKARGLPIDQLIIGTNSNDILTRFFETGTLAMGTVEQTISPHGYPGLQHLSDLIRSLRTGRQRIDGGDDEFRRGGPLPSVTIALPNGPRGFPRAD